MPAKTLCRRLVLEYCTTNMVRGWETLRTICLRLSSSMQGISTRRREMCEDVAVASPSNALCIFLFVRLDSEPSLLCFPPR